MTKDIVHKKKVSWQHSRPTVFSELLCILMLSYFSHLSGFCHPVSELQGDIESLSIWNFSHGWLNEKDSPLLMIILVDLEKNPRTRQHWFY